MVKILNLFFQNVGSRSEFDNLLGSDLDGFASSWVVTFSSWTNSSAEGTEAYESDFTVLLQFSFGDFDHCVESFLCVNFCHASFSSDGIDEFSFIHCYRVLVNNEKIFFTDYKDTLKI